MQIFVVALVLPSLILASRTRIYPAVRIAGALLAALASVGWIVERLFDVATPVDSIVGALARHGPSIALAGLGVALAARWPTALAVALHSRTLRPTAVRK